MPLKQTNTHKLGQIVKIGPKHQVTIPKNIFQKLGLEPGDFLQAMLGKGYIVMYPKQLIAKSSAIYLTKKEQSVAFLVRDKVNQIQDDMINSKGLTDREADLAVKLGLVDESQSWWWKENWQQGERKAEQDIKQKNLSKSFGSAKELMDHLDNAYGD